MERRLAVHARASRQALSAALVAAVLVGGVPVVVAAPKTADAKAAFDRGVAAYKKGDYAAASEALGASYGLEQDIETLFAWAQAERKLDRCDKAIDLYDKLLAYDMPEENKAAIRDKLAECKAALGDKPAHPPEATPTPTTAPTPTSESVGEAAPSPAPERPESPPGAAPAWWKDPIGGALVGAGVIGIGIGAAFLVSASAADQDKDSAATYGDYKALSERAESRGRLGVIAAGVGGALVIGGIVRYVTRDSGEQRTQVTGWVAPDGGGIVAVGRF